MIPPRLLLAVNVGVWPQFTVDPFTVGAESGAIVTVTGTVAEAQGDVKDVIVTNPFPVLIPPTFTWLEPLL
jgi:hypothetical protein